MIELKEVVKSYGAKRALYGVSLTIPQGEIVGLFGENGAGKTTLLKCMLGLLRHRGTVTLDGEPITGKNIARLSFATCEHSFFPGLTAENHRVFYQAHFPAFRDKRFRALMEFFELPSGKLLRHFSTGQKNQFEVILALSQGVYKVLLGILEPTETVILSTHLLEEVQNFIGRAVLIRRGKIVGDTSMEALEDSGRDLMTYVKETYHYRPDRVSRALSDLTE